MRATWTPLRRSFTEQKYSVKRRFMKISTASVVACVLGLAAGQTAVRAQASAPLGQQAAGIEVLARGPIHEAYGQPVEREPTAGPIIPKAPPQPVPEQPPDLKPEGANVQWMAGFWAWDD